MKQKIWNQIKTYLVLMAIIMSFSTAIGQQPATLEDIQSLYGITNNQTDDWGFTETPKGANYLTEKLANAFPDEYWYGYGDERNLYEWGGVDPESLPTEAKLKTNQAYVWGMAKAGNNIWFGTAPNTLCMVFGTYLGMTGGITTDCYTCEFGDAHYTNEVWINALGGQLETAHNTLGDWRPSRIFMYDIQNKTNIDKTDDLDPASKIKLQMTIGIRSAGTADGVVFLAGPSFATVNMFAFNAETGEFLGSQTFPEYTNIRKWIEHEGVLYTAVGNSGGGGAVLRWTGSKSNPFQFEVVGTLDSQGAELAVHEGKLFVTTWGGSELVGGSSYSGLWMSPEIPSTGLTSAHASGWSKVWNVSMYENDPDIAATYGGGALASFDGYLYWGTMHVPMTSFMSHLRANEDYYDWLDDNTSMREEAMMLAFLATNRAISIFRGKDFSAAGGNVELCYGLPVLPTFVEEDPIENSHWELQPNGMGGQMPLFGGPGFNNLFNNYTWTMAVHDDKLFVGTMDWSQLIMDGFIGDFLEGEINDALPPDMQIDFGHDYGGYLDDIDLSFLPGQIQSYIEEVGLMNLVPLYGADLYYFESSDKPARFVNLKGMDNYHSYGIRTMVSEDYLYLGMANPINLANPLNGDCEGQGGWELKRIRMVDQGSVPGNITATRYREENHTLYIDLDQEWHPDIIPFQHYQYMDINVVPKVRGNIDPVTAYIIGGGATLALHLADPLPEDKQITIEFDNTANPIWTASNNIVNNYGPATVQVIPKTPLSSYGLIFVLIGILIFTIIKLRK